MEKCQNRCLPFGSGKHKVGVDEISKLGTQRFYPQMAATFPPISKCRSRDSSVVILRHATDREATVLYSIFLSVHLFVITCN